MNHPAKVEGLWIYQSSFGWAPVIEVTDDGDGRSSGPVVMDRDPAPEGVVEFAMPWRGVVKLPGAGAGGLDRAIELELWPDSRALTALLEPGRRTAGDARRVRPDHPVHGLGRRARRPRDEPPRHDGARRGLVGHRGRRAHRRPRRRRRPARGRGRIGLHDLVPRAPAVLGVPGGARPPGCPSCWPPLSSSSWDCCPRCTAPGARSGCAPIPTAMERSVRVGGFALQRKPQFEEEFARLVDALSSAAGGTSAPRPEPDDRAEDREKVQTP